MGYSTIRKDSLVVGVVVAADNGVAVGDGVCVVGVVQSVVSRSGCTALQRKTRS